MICFPQWWNPVPCLLWSPVEKGVCPSALRMHPEGSIELWWGLTSSPRSACVGTCISLRLVSSCLERTAAFSLVSTHFPLPDLLSITRNYSSAGISSLTRTLTKCWWVHSFPSSSTLHLVFPLLYAIAFWWSIWTRVRSTPLNKEQMQSAGGVLQLEVQKSHATVQQPSAEFSYHLLDHPSCAFFFFYFITAVVFQCSQTWICSICEYDDFHIYLPIASMSLKRW